jgi:cytochrome c oxidase subunit 1
MSSIAVPKKKVPVKDPPGYLAEDNYLNNSSGFASWAFTLDHKRIGVMYLFSILSMFFVGGLFATLIRAELLTPGDSFTSPDTYNQMFSLHGIIMVFLVIIPGIPAALGNIVLPIMLGAKDVAFPKLNLLSYYLYVIGALLAVYAMVTGGVDTGWTFYTPYSATTTTNVIPVVTAAFILGFSSIFTGLNFIVTIHKLRPPGMGWYQMPLFLWAIYSTAVIQVLATPVLGITLLLLIVERTMKVGIFNPALGGDPVLFQHFFWFYSHPAVYIMILPAMGVISELISTHSRKHIFGYSFIAFSSIAIALFGFLVWGHHMFTSGQSGLANMIFSALTYTVSIPSAVKVFSWLATLYRGNIQLNTPMLYALGFIFIFGIGGLTGIFVGALAVDIHLHDTYFVVAHFHYVMMGSAILAFVAGLHHWWPKITGRMYNEVLGRWSWAMVFIGFNLTFIPQFIMGSLGMPRRYAHYPQEYQIYHVISTIGAFLLLAGFLLNAYYFLHSLYRGAKAPANPWGGATLEWQTTSPPPLYNFDEPPVLTDPYDYSNLKYDENVGGYVPRKGADRPASKPAHT